MSNMDGMEWKRHMLGAKEILRQKAMSGLPKGRDTGFISTFMALWESLSSVTTGESPLLDFLTVSVPVSNPDLHCSNTTFFSLPERAYCSPISRNPTTKEPNTHSSAQ